LIKHDGQRIALIFNKQGQDELALLLHQGAIHMMATQPAVASAEIDPRLLLVQFIRERLHLTGTHVGCDTSQ
jgi:xanthine dehydrogenase iron-sulfur cluster and FAD-binding subunit A